MSQSVAMMTPTPPQTIEYSLRHQEMEERPGHERTRVGLEMEEEEGFSWYTGGGERFLGSL